MPITLNYYYELDPYCVDCGRKLQQSFVDNDEQQAHYHHYGWGPICRRCNHARWQYESGSSLPYESVFRNDDDEVYDE